MEPLITGDSTSRDLGTAGGGPIPGNQTSNAGETNASSTTTPSSSTETTTEARNASATDRTGQGNIGGRNPSQPQTAMGDQDRTMSRPGDETADPMTSRAPDKVNQQKAVQKEQQKEADKQDQPS